MEKQHFLNGVESASNWPKTFLLVYSSPSIQKALLTVFLFNGIFFLGGQVFLETFYSNSSVFGYPYVSLLGFPTYFTLLGINGRFYSRVAEKSFQIQARSSALPTTVSSLPSTILTAILYMNCGVFVNILSKIPFIGKPLSFLMSCIILSYYCFEFQWVYKNWNMEKRLSYMEKHWAYFLGFGFPGTCMTFFLSFLRSGAVFALMYPCFIIMSMMAVPTASKQLPIFYPIRKLNEIVILFIRFVGGVQADTLISNKQE